MPSTRLRACLLGSIGADIKVREPNFEAMMRGRKAFEPPRFMTVNEAVLQLLEVEEKKGGGGASEGEGLQQLEVEEKKGGGGASGSSCAASHADPRHPRPRLRSVQA